MKKIKIILSILIFMVSATLVSACGGVSGTLKFKYSEIFMAVNQEMDLANLVELDGCELKNIEFISSNPEIVYVRSNGRLVSRSEGVSLITARGYTDTILEVTVEGTSIKFATPSNLSYDETKNAVVWDAVYAGDVVATRYNVTVIKDGGEPKVETTNTNSYEILEAGTYKIKVSCGARQDVGILNSDESEEYEFSKLSAPTNLVYDDTAGTLSWEAENDSLAFRVLINGVASEELSTENSQHLTVAPKTENINIITTKTSINLKDPKKYTILVMAVAKGDQENVFGATSTQRLELTRLSSPELSINNGIITWEDSEQGATAFDLTIVGATTIKETIYKNSAGKYSYNLQGVDAGEYSIQIFAKGDSIDHQYSSDENYLTSDVAQLSGIEKLPKQQIVFDKENKTINVVDFNLSNGYRLELTIRKDGVLVKSQDISSTGKLVYDFTDAGAYEFVLSNLAKSGEGGNLEINADNSEKLTVVKLGKANNATHAINEGVYNVSGYEIVGATNYVVEIALKGTNTRYELTDANNKVSDIFTTAGEYVVNIYAKGTDDDINKVYYLDSETNTSLSTIRLADCVLSNNESKKAIVWNDVASLGSLRYAYSLTGASEDSGILEDNEFSYAGLGVGSYSLNVWATSAVSSGVQTIILDSINKALINFSITKTLATPILGWQKNVSEEGTSYCLTITNVEGATSYTVKLNGNAVKALDATTTEYIAYDVTTFFEESGDGGNGETYLFEVEASSTNEYYNTSAVNSLTAVRAAAPTSFNYSVIANNSESNVPETITSSKTESWYAGTQILINNIETADPRNEEVQGNDSFIVKIKYLANQNNVSTSNGNLYYIDSDYAEFKFVKISNSLIVNGNTLTWSVDETTQEITNRLIITQGTSIQIIDVTQRNEFNLNEIDTAKFSFGRAITISLQTVVRNFKGNISGEYQGGKFVSGTMVGGTMVLDSFYITSDLVSINVQNVDTNQSLSVSENDGAVTIDWVKSENLTSWKINNANTNVFSSEDFESSIENKFSIEEMLSNGTRNIYLFTVTRVPQVRTINVSKSEIEEDNEVITAVNKPTSADALVCLIEGNRVTNLRGVTSTLETILSAYYKAGANNGADFFLDSFVTEFKFKRLAPLNVASNFNVYNDIISWNIEETGTYNKYTYLVTLYDSNNNSFSLEFEVEDSTAINFNQQKYADIIYSLTGDKFIKVQKIADEFNADSNLTNYLTSVESEKQLYVLSAPTDVVISSASGDNSQTDITISWTVPDDGEIAPTKYDIKIYNKYTEWVITTTSSYTLSTSERQTLFANAGEWFVEVKSVGGKDTVNAKDMISSKYSQKASVVRLEKSQSVSVSNSGLIEWGAVRNAKGYVLEYSYTDSNFAVQTKSLSFDSSTLSYQMTDEELATKFSGTINVVLYALGVGSSQVADGETAYMSSHITSTFTRVVAPEFELTSTKMIFTKYEEYVNGELIYVNATIDGNTVLNLEITPTIDANEQYVWTYPKEYSYLKDGKLVKVDFSTAKNIIFNVCASVVKPNHITSNTLSKSATILANMTNLRFARAADGVVHFYATNPNAGTQTKITIGSLTFEQTGDVDLAFTDDILSTIGSAWTIVVKALGSSTTTPVLIEGGTTSISGSKLANVQNITTETSSGSLSHTKVVWSKVTNATDYWVKYYNQANTSNIMVKDGYGTIAEETMGSNYAAGMYAFAVRPIGNVKTTEISNNIILDGTYCEEQTITKLETISNVAVQRGFICFDEVTDADAYVAVVYTDISDITTAKEYELVPYTLPTGESGNFYYSDAMMNAIAGGAQYYLRLYAKSTTSNYISSEFSFISGTTASDNYIEISTFADTDNVITLSHPKIDSSENVNYAITYATFTTNSAVDAGILLEINGKVEYLTVKQYTLDADGDWDAGVYNIRYAQLGSDSIPSNKRVYLTSFGDITKVTKLGTTTISVGIKDTKTLEQKITFKSINGATAYFMYLGGVYTHTYASSKSDIEIDISQINVGTYDSLAICAISTDINYLAGDKIYLVDESSGTNAKIRKLAAPDTLDVKDGAFSFIPSSEELLGMYMNGGTQTPFYTTPSLVAMQFIEFKFTNLTTGAVYELVDRADNYLYITDDLISELESNGMAEKAEQLKESQRKGFPYLNYNFMDFAEVLTAGVYKIQTRLIGNVTEYEGPEEAPTAATILLSSNYSEYNTAIKKYISGAPNIRVENNNDIYNLKFTNVTVNTEYFDDVNNKKTYALVGIYTDEDGNAVREELATVTAGVKDTNDVIFNLTDLINNEILTSKYTGLFVYIKGNDSTGALNGLCSNTIKIIVLDEITAFIKHGIISWNAQNNATKYVVSYGAENKVDISYVDGLSIYSWDAKPLDAGTSYNVTIMAYGTQNSTDETGGILVLSGKVTQIGTIQKLDRVTSIKNGIAVDKGIYSWNAIANASGYDVYITTNEIVDGNYGDYQTIYENLFETNVSDNGIYYYYFRAVGDTYDTLPLDINNDGELTNQDIIYVNSDVCDYNKGQRCTNIQELALANGIIVWKIPDSVTGLGYKLTFNRGGEDIIINLRHEDATKKSGYVYFNTNDYEELLKEGNYLVKVQAYYINKTETNTGTETYYLISSPTSQTFHKFVAIKENDIKVENGIISWNYAGGGNAKYHFRLQFVYTNEETGETFEQTRLVPSGVNQYEGVVFDSDMSKWPITLTIYVVPGAIDANGNAVDTNDAYALSVPFVYGTEIHQFNKVNEDTIAIYIETNGNLKIDWIDPNTSDGSQTYKYEICYYTDDAGNKVYKTVNESEIICGEDIDFDIDGEYSLKVKIRVIPVVENYISSAWTTERVIERPTGITNLRYDEENYVYTWDKYNTGDEAISSFYYKVKDEVGHYEEIDGVNTFVVDSVYIFNAAIGDETFTPFVIGWHRVSVAVIIKSSGNTGLMSEYCEEVIANIDLFDSGNGTDSNPFLIKTPEQFSNMKYRLTKDSKNNDYFVGTYVDGELVVGDTQVSAGANNTVYHFKQAEHLELTTETALANYPNANGITPTVNYEFNGSYDGDGYSLQLMWTSNIMNASASPSMLTIFEKVGRLGVISNVNVLCGIDTTISINKMFTVALLANNNYGKITAIAVGKNAQNSTLSFSKNMTSTFTLSLLVNTNYGTIEYAENFYNVVIESPADGNNKNTSAMSYGTFTISGNENSRIAYTKNYGDITIRADQVNIGGIVTSMVSSATLTQSANCGDINVFVRGTYRSIIGGLVGVLNNGTISYCYSIGDISVASSSELTVNAYVGGLVGNSYGDNISYSYVNVTKNQNVLSGYEAFSGIYQLVGYFTSVSASSSKSVYVYYNASRLGSGFNTASGFSSSGFIGYSYVTEICEVVEEFRSDYTDEQGNPRLSWEFNYNPIWRE